MFIGLISLNKNYGFLHNIYKKQDSAMVLSIIYYQLQALNEFKIFETRARSCKVC